jgi:hypothetical protein
MAERPTPTTRHFFATGASGLPLVADRSVLTVETAGHPLPRPGDLVVFRARGRLVCHRVLWHRRRRGYLIKGDANLGADGWIEPGAIVGKVTAIDGESLSAWPSRAVQALLSVHGLVQYALFRAIFRSRWGMALGGWKARHLTRRPLATRWFRRVTAPWLGRCGRGDQGIDTGVPAGQENG